MITIPEIYYRASNYFLEIKNSLGILIESKDPTRMPQLYRISSGALVEAYDKFAFSETEFSNKEAQEEMKYFGKVIILDGSVEVRTLPDFQSFMETIFTARL